MLDVAQVEFDLREFVQIQQQPLGFRAGYILPLQEFHQHPGFPELVVVRFRGKLGKDILQSGAGMTADLEKDACSLPEQLGLNRLIVKE